MSTISENLAAILSARYGKDVRQAIHDGIQNCYNDSIQGVPGPEGPQGPPGPEGPIGDTGERGPGITSIDRTSGNGAPGTTDTYTITFENGGSSTFEVYNGSDGGASSLSTPRMLTIGKTGKLFDGTSDVEWSLDEIGLFEGSNTEEQGADIPGYINVKNSVCADGLLVSGDGAHDDTTGIQAAINLSISQGKVLYFPPGIYMVNQTGLRVVFTKNDQSFIMRGAGRDVTTLKQEDLAIDLGGKWVRLIHFSMEITVNQNNVTRLGSIEISNLTFDKNARGNPELLKGPSGTVGYGGGENATMISLAGALEKSITIGSLIIRACTLHDKIGGGINFPASHCYIVGHVIIEDIYGSGFTDDRKYMERGEIEVTICTEDFVISNCNVRYAQIEPVAPSPTAIYGASPSRMRVTKLNNSTINRFEFSERLEGIDANHDRLFSSFIFINNCKINSFMASSATTLVENCYLGFSDTSIIPGIMSISNSVIALNYIAAENNIRSIYPRQYYGLKKQSMTFTNCQFTLDTQWYATRPTNYVFNLLAKNTDKNAITVKLIDCEFDGRFAGIIKNDGSGTVEVRGCKIRCYQIPFVTGAFGSYAASLYLENNDYSEVTGDLISVSDGNALWEINFGGDIDISKYRIVPASTLARPQNVKAKPKMSHSAIPSSLSGRRFFKGEVVFNTDPAPGGFVGWVCTAAGTPGTWKGFGQIAV